MKKSKKRQILSAILLCSMIFLAFETAYGRYEKRKTKDLSFEVREPATFQVMHGQGWTKQEDEERFSFSVSNMGHKEDTYFTVRLASTEGIRYDNAKILLVIEKENGAEKGYVGFPSELDVTSELYMEMGAGCVYYFYDEQGNELIWKLRGSASGTQSVQEFELMLEGAKEPNLLEIIVTEAPQPEK